MLMHKYFIIFNNNTNIDLGLYITSRPSKPSPIKRYEEVQVAGKDGLLYRDKGYGDIDISVSFNFAAETDDTWDTKFREIKRWLLKRLDNKLKFSDDLDYFYKVNKVTIDTPERVLRRIGRFTVTFTCQPYVYLSEGLEEIELNNYLFNYYEASQPTYIITGDGNLKLTVNDIEITANVGQKLIINTELGLCYREDGTINNTALNGRYKDLELKEGDNTFSFNEGFDIKIIPNWRCL